MSLLQEQQNICYKHETNNPFHKPENQWKKCIEKDYPGSFLKETTYQAQYSNLCQYSKIYDNRQDKTDLLFEFICSGDKVGVDWVLSNYGININLVRNAANLTPLQATCTTAHPNQAIIAEILIQHGAICYLSDDMEYHVSDKNIDVFKIILKYCYLRNHSETENNLLKVAQQSGDHELLSLLEINNTLLDLASTFAATDPIKRDRQATKPIPQNSVQLLCNRDANPNMKDKWGQTPLHALAQRYSVDSKIDLIEQIKFLINSNARVNICDYDGNTPLHLLLLNYYDGIQAGNVIHNQEAKTAAQKIISLLMDMGANSYACNNAHITPIEIALSIGAIDFVDLLKKQNRKAEG